MSSSTASVRPTARYLRGLTPFTAALLSACATAGYLPTSLQLGQTRAEVERQLGAPAAVYIMADGHARLDYHALRLGQRTYMIDFDAGGRVVRVDQVLDEAHFGTIQAGMSEAEVLRLIGPPNAGTGSYNHPAPAYTWVYRFETIQKCVVFELPFDPQTHRTMEPGAYPPDKTCGPIRT